MIVTVPIIPSPYEHLTARPHSGVRQAANWRIRCAGSCPTIRVGVISPAGVHCPTSRKTTPYDHFTPSPDTRVNLSGFRRTGGAGDYPAVAAGIISPARIQVAAVINTTPDDHFTARPHRGVRTSCRRCVDEVGRRPGISRRIVSSTGIQKEILSTIATPNVWFTRASGALVVLVTRHASKHVPSGFNAVAIGGRV